MKTKVSATIDQGRLAEALKLTGVTNVSALLDQALEALIVARLEAAHVQGYVEHPQDDEDMMALPDTRVWADIPWDDES